MMTSLIQNRIDIINSIRLSLLDEVFNNYGMEMLLNTSLSVLDTKKHSLDGRTVSVYLKGSTAKKYKKSITNGTLNMLVYNDVTYIVKEVLLNNKDIVLSILEREFSSSNNLDEIFNNLISDDIISILFNALYFDNKNLLIIDL